jgi:hypothetical protein
LALVKLFISIQNVINRSLLAIILILEYHFFLLQQGNQKSEKIMELATAEYTKSNTAAVVEKAVKDILRQDDGDEDKLCEMIIDVILQNRMCGSHSSWSQILILLAPV